MSTEDELRRIWLFEGLTDDQLSSLSPFSYTIYEEIWP